MKPVPPSLRLVEWAGTGRHAFFRGTAARICGRRWLAEPCRHERNQAETAGADQRSVETLSGWALALPTADRPCGGADLARHLPRRDAWHRRRVRLRKIDA